jgi:hypothetical protein
MDQPSRSHGSAGGLVKSDGFVGHGASSVVLNGEVTGLISER